MGKNKATILLIWEFLNNLDGVNGGDLNLIEACLILSNNDEPIKHTLRILLEDLEIDEELTSEEYKKVLDLQEKL